ncbi:HAUS augmin-like complex subunit 2 isoform X1 [Polypterus senegalus]|uniref:HAUS augmin-like complex subunit 2 isoform X1 n=2 Tax=Polypterus senegalus TaxID=55291 RepID=UPI0019629D0A|nr:HAUS augmin-like complex subunit 2 isoform X1 [Polypterus senegalus]
MAFPQRFSLFICLSMNPWDSKPSTSSAAQVLAGCVSARVLSQDMLDSIPNDTNVFSEYLQQAEQTASMTKEIDQKCLEMELLQLEKEGAEVTHPFYLDQKIKQVQKFTTHLQEVLREQRCLRQRLMKPLCQQNLPIEANFHRYVVELLDKAVHFIGNLESSVQIARSVPNVGQSIKSLENGLAQLLTLVTEFEEVSEEVLHWRKLQASLLP